MQSAVLHMLEERLAPGLCLEVVSRCQGHGCTLASLSLVLVPNFTVGLVRMVEPACTNRQHKQNLSMNIFTTQGSTHLTSLCGVLYMRLAPCTVSLQCSSIWSTCVQDGVGPRCRRRIEPSSSALLCAAGPLRTPSLSALAPMVLGMLKAPGPGSAAASRSSGLTKRGPVPSLKAGRLFFVDSCSAEAGKTMSLSSCAVA